MASAKAEANLQSHGVSFELAETAFKDLLAIDFLDDREDYSEERTGRAHSHYFGPESNQE